MRFIARPSAVTYRATDHSANTSASTISQPAPAVDASCSSGRRSACTMSFGATSRSRSSTASAAPRFSPNTPMTENAAISAGNIARIA